MKCYNCTCLGESHKSTGKECQDYSCTLYDVDNGLYVAVVCDGHGGDKYFRSAFGAKAAAEVTLSTVKTFVSNWDYSPVKGANLMQFGIYETIEQNEDIDIVFRCLFSSIYSQWIAKIAADSKRPLTEWEKANVKPEHIELLHDEERTVKAYGCTLMAYVQTPNYWFAFHLGDGKCVMIDKNLHFSQPIPWDERCFLNTTTSMCDNEPINEFRCCIQADGNFPVAIFLGSDGLDDTFGDGERLHNFYGNIIKEIYNLGFDEVKSQIETSLPVLSKRGSKDDMSIAFVYDEERVADVAQAVRNSQITSIRNDITNIEASIAKWKDKLDAINLQIPEHDDSCQNLQTQKHQIEQEYERAKKNLETARKYLERLTAETTKESEDKRTMSDLAESSNQESEHSAPEPTKK